MVVADAQNETLYLDITQTFHLWFSIFKPKPATLVTKLKLQSYGAPWDPSVVGVSFTLFFPLERQRVFVWIDLVSHYVARRFLPTRAALRLSPTPTRGSTRLYSKETGCCDQQCPRKCLPVGIWSVGPKGEAINAEDEDGVWCFMLSLNIGGVWYLYTLALNELCFCNTLIVGRLVDTQKPGWASP